MICLATSGFWQNDLHQILLSPGSTGSTVFMSVLGYLSTCTGSMIYMIFLYILLVLYKLSGLKSVHTHTYLQKEHFLVLWQIYFHPCAFWVRSFHMLMREDFFNFNVPFTGHFSSDSTASMAMKGLKLPVREASDHVHPQDTAFSKVF